ncbi:energy transducer TonB [Thalassotalea fusca]
MKNLTIFSGAGLITFALFVLMATLVSQQQAGLTKTPPYVPVTVMQAPPESTVNKMIRSLPKIPEVQPPQVQTTTFASETQSTVDYNYEPVDMDIGGSIGGIAKFAGMSEGEARPIVRTNPTYPMDAARKGIEGWVILSFDINEIGEVFNVAVQEAEPKRVFDRAAKQALRKWKYRAKVVDGKPVIQQGMTVQLDFTMQNQQ